MSETDGIRVVRDSVRYLRNVWHRSAAFGCTSYRGLDPEGPVPVSRAWRITRRGRGGYSAEYRGIAMTGARAFCGIAVGPMRVQARERSSPRRGQGLDLRTPSPLSCRGRSLSLCASRSKLAGTNLKVRPIVHLFFLIWKKLGNRW